MKMLLAGFILMSLSITGIFISIIVPLGKPGLISKFSGFGFFILLHCSLMFLLAGAGMIRKTLNLPNKKT
jgi:hypothetical protein